MKTYVPARFEFDTNLIGRMIELAYPQDSAVRPVRPRGRVSAVCPRINDGLTLWLEIEDAECAGRYWGWWCKEPQVGDVVMVTTNMGYGDAVIRIIKEPLSDSALLNASAALRVALEDVVRARRLVDEALHQRDKRDAP